MTMKYDLIIVGAGPAGLMAAKSALEHNLRVALIEKRRDVTNWTRADSMMLLGLEGDFLQENIEVQVGRVVFPNNGFSVAYTGGLYPLYYKRAFSPGGHRMDFCTGDPIAIVFDKGILLRDLLREVEQLGVDLFSGTLGVRAENTQNGVRVSIKGKGKESWLDAKKLIAADGIASRITESIGLNKDRTNIGSVKVVQYVLEGVVPQYPNSWMNFYGKSLSPLIPLHFQQTVHGESIHKLGAGRPITGNPETDVKNFMKRSHFAHWFENARVIKKMGCVLKAFTPIEHPVQDNVLVIGDAACSGEVENQGALLCGYHAGRAVYRELEDGKGFDEYCSWWRRSFYFFYPEVNRVAQGFAINPFYEDEEIDYLFSLVEGETLEGTIVLYKTPKIMWDAILRHKNRIMKERPELSKKLEKISHLTVEEGFTDKK